MKKTHLIANAHLDPVWLWQWQEGFAEIKATFRSALDRLREFDDLIFTSACSAYYMWIEESDPAMFAEIQARVAEGRWCLAGGWLIQPDCNMPGGESFARHALISQRYFHEKFGTTAKTGYNVDSFGHNGNLPQILRQSGMEHYVFMRPGPHEKELPAALFDWESADGSCVRTYRIPERYNIDLNNLEVFSRIREAEGEAAMAFFGVGNHGGGPTIALLTQMHDLLPTDCVYSHPNAFFDETKAQAVPRVRTDLQYHAKGCYSAMSEIKADNQKAECRLLETEAFSLLSEHLLHTPYPAAQLSHGWKDVLFNQFHDILCGCAIRDAYEDARYAHGEALAIAQKYSNYALQQISWQIDTTAGHTVKPYKPEAMACKPAWLDAEGIGTPVVIFNPLARPLQATASVRVLPTRMTDETGAPLAIQAVRDAKTNGQDKWKVLFPVTLPPLGYCVYRMYFEGEETSCKATVHSGANWIENRYLRATFGPTSGELTSLFDQTTGKELIAPGGAPVLMDETACDTWAHGVAFFKDEVARGKTGHLHLTENGPVRVTMRVTQEIENTRITRDYSLCGESRSLTVHVKVDFHEKHRMLKLTLPVAAQTPRAFAEIPFGYIERPTDGSEQVFSSWVALGDIGLAATGKHSFDAEGSILSLTVLRGAIYADHYGVRDEFCEYMEQGEHSFTYTLFPYHGPGEATWQAQELLHAPTAIQETFHPGPLSTVFSFLSIDQPNIVLSALKKAEDGDGIVLRCYEAEGRNTQAVFRLADATWQAAFRHNEIKTFLLRDGKATEVNFMEWETKA